MYHIFEVHDYKGGEQAFSLNLTTQQFISSLAEKFENVFEEKEINTVEEIEKIIKKALDDEDYFSIYAGGGSTVLNLFRIENGILLEVDIYNWTYEIAEYIKENWK